MILVTGASGYLGQHVVLKLVQRGEPHAAHPGRFVDLVEVLWRTAQVLGFYRPDVVIHCAAVVPKDQGGYNDAQAALDSVQMLTNLACMDASLRRPIIFASSLVAADPHRSLYAAGKWFAEQVLSTHRHPGDVILRLPGLFGLPRRSGAVYDYVTTGSTLHGPWWPLMHVEDAAEYLVRAALDGKQWAIGPHAVGYGGDVARLYGDLGVTLDQRIEAYAQQVKEVA